MTIPEDTLAWLRQAAAAGQADAQVMQELLRRVEALEQRPIAGDYEPAPATEESSVAVPPDAEEPQTLHSVALQMVDTLARLGVILEIRETLKRAIREPMAPAPAAVAGPVATDNGLLRCYAQAVEDALPRFADNDEIKAAGRRAIYNLGREHAASQAICPHVRSSDEGTSYCNLAEQVAAAQEPIEPKSEAQPAPAGGLVERVTSRVEHAVDADQELEWLALESAARAAIREVAAWLQQQHTGRIANGNQFADLLREEVDR